MAQDCAFARGEHRAEACFAVHQVLVRLRRTLERKNFAHRPHGGEQAEIERVLGIDEVLEGQPITERLPRMSGIPGTCSGSAAAPRMTNLPLCDLASPLTS